MIAENSHVKSFLLNEDFRKDKNRHKYVILWSSKFYRLINRIMRIYHLHDIMKTKYTRHFVKRMIKYFFEYGLEINELLKKGSKLYRGLDKDFLITETYTENGFMSTSLSINVAKTFAGNGGNILMFDMVDLPSKTPFVIIDEDIDDGLLEKEVLFLPGTIHIKKTSKDIKAYYSMDPYIKTIKDTIQDGGGHDCDLLF